MQSLPMDGESLAVLAEYGLGEARLSGCHLRRYEAGEAMARQNEAMDALLFVRSGNAKVCINARNGRHLIICYYISSGILGDVELLTEAQAARQRAAGGLKALRWEKSWQARHVFTHVRWDMQGYAVVVGGSGELQWYTEEQRRQMAIPSAFEKATRVLRELEGE